MQFLDLNNFGPVLLAAASIAFNPLYWNVVGRYEYKTRKISGLLSPIVAVYTFAATIFGLGLLRDYLFKLAMVDQPTFDFPLAVYAGYALVCFGMVLVLGSTARLGIMGTFLGDYFGFLMKERVTGFPFSHFEHPMYTGSTASFLGFALMEQSYAGILLTVWVHIVYAVAENYEGPFTTMIYQQKPPTAKDN